MRLLVSLLVVLVAAAAEEAAPDVSSRDAIAAAIAADLQSTSPETRAWAAYRAGQWRVVDARAALVAVASIPPGDAEEDRCAYAAALDALVRLERPAAPSVVAVAIRAHHDAEALILAARAPGANAEALLGIVDTARWDESWLAAAQLLVAMRSPRLAELLARDLSLSLALRVVDDGARGGGSRRFGSSFGSGGVVVPEGFPPAVAYSLTFDVAPGAVVLCDGSRPVLWRREEATGRHLGFCHHHQRIERDRQRIELLTRLARPPTTTSLEAVTRRSIVWTDLVGYLCAAQRERDALVAEHARLLARLSADGLLPDDAAARFPARIEVLVEDARDVRVPPLPPPLTSSRARLAAPSPLR